MCQSPVTNLTAFVQFNFQLISNCHEGWKNEYGRFIKCGEDNSRWTWDAMFLFNVKCIVYYTIITCQQRGSSFVFVTLANPLCRVSALPRSLCVHMSMLWINGLFAPLQIALSHLSWWFYSLFNKETQALWNYNSGVIRNVPRFIVNMAWTCLTTWRWKRCVQSYVAEYISHADCCVLY